jgi:hypothetical protein
MYRCDIEDADWDTMHVRQLITAVLRMAGHPEIEGRSVARAGSDDRRSQA